MALAWPLILANLTMQMIQATDVVLMGWLGPRQLAAAALGLNLTFAFVLLGMGMTWESRVNDVRTARRYVRGLR